MYLERGPSGSVDILEPSCYVHPSFMTICCERDPENWYGYDLIYYMIDWFVLSQNVEGRSARVGVEITLASGRSTTCMEAYCRAFPVDGACTNIFRAGSWLSQPED